MAIPIFHENLYSTAVVATAALINALDLADKESAPVRVVICGAGTVGLGCARLLARARACRRRTSCSTTIRGLVSPDRDDLNRYQRAFARRDPARTLAEGAARRRRVPRRLRRRRPHAGDDPLDEPLPRSSSPWPRPTPRSATRRRGSTRRDAIVGTSLGQDPNAIVDLLSFPYIFRGALDVQASSISEGMMLAAARSLAELAREEVPEEVSRAYGDESFTFGPEYLLPKPIDPRILVRESAAVARAGDRGGAGRPRPCRPSSTRKA